MQDFVKKGELKPNAYAKDTISQNHSSDWMDLARLDPHRPV
jgi:hypothetical protein